MDTEVVRTLLAQVADETFDCSSFRQEDGVQVVLADEDNKKPLVWVVPHVLTPSQCDAVIEKSEKAGMTAAGYASGSIRTAKRTQMYMDEELANKAFSQLDPTFLSRLQQSDGLTVNGLHPNWRVVRYDPGDYFGPHYDQSDVSTPRRKTGDGKKDFLFSSHTMVVNLSPNVDEIEGGAIRFYPRKDYSKAVDVSVPRGWGIAFKQNGMLHAGHQVIRGTKYVAQSGLLRLLPEGMTHKPSTFMLGRIWMKPYAYTSNL